MLLNEAIRKCGNLFKQTFEMRMPSEKENSLEYGTLSMNESHSLSSIKEKK